MTANLIAYNQGIKDVSQASVEFVDNQNTVIELKIAGHKYSFNSKGELLGSTEVQSCMAKSTWDICAQPNNDQCIPNPNFTPYD
jgi:hypothetical protein